MKDRSFDKKIRRLAQDVANELQDIMMIRLSDDSYELFDRYSIKRISGTWTVSRHYVDGNHEFYNLRNAATWCIYDYRNKLLDAKQIRELDRKLSSAVNQAQLHQRLIKTAKTHEALDLYSIKLNEEMLMQLHVSKRIQQYIDDAQHWQKKKFEIKARHSA